MSNIFGIGLPSIITSAGIIYTDNRTGKQYKQNKSPFGNDWTEISTGSVSAGSGSLNVTGATFYTYEQSLTYSDIVSASGSSRLFLTNLSSTTGFINVISVNSYFENTTIPFNSLCYSNIELESVGNYYNLFESSAPLSMSANNIVSWYESPISSTIPDLQNINLNYRTNPSSGNIIAPATQDGILNLYIVYNIIDL